VVHDRAQARQTARLRQGREQDRPGEAGGRRFDHGKLKVLARAEMGE
jgi:hypothetical protein